MCHHWVDNVWTKKYALPHSGTSLNLLFALLPFRFRWCSSIVVGLRRCFGIHVVIVLCHHFSAFLSLIIELGELEVDLSRVTRVVCDQCGCRKWDEKCQLLNDGFVEETVCVRGREKWSANESVCRCTVVCRHMGCCRLTPDIERVNVVHIHRVYVRSTWTWIIWLCRSVGVAKCCVSNFDNQIEYKRTCRLGLLDWEVLRG